MEMEAALEMEDLLHSFVSSRFGGRPEDTVAPYNDGWAALEMEDLIHNVRVELNRKGSGGNGGEALAAVDQDGEVLHICYLVDKVGKDGMEVQRRVLVA